MAADPSTSYVAKLHAKGLPKIAQKLGEEGVETVIAALSGSREELVGEAADLLFHLLVLLGEKQVPLAEVLAELDRREGVSGIAEKAARKPD
jgi:phosphoribosyl-ATP pyrophosphohydrolase